MFLLRQSYKTANEETLNRENRRKEAFKTGVRSVTDTTGKDYDMQFIPYDYDVVLDKERDRIRSIVKQLAEAISSYRQMKREKVWCNK